jgi:hypothetical protein
MILVYAVGSDGENVLKLYRNTMEEAEELKEKLLSLGFRRVEIYK